MMSMMRVRTVLPFLLALVAVLVYQQPAPAAAQGPVPEADGTWHTVSAPGDPPVRFNVTWQGNVNVHWNSQFGIVYEDTEEGTRESVPHDYRLFVTWVETVDGETVGKNLGRSTSKYRTRFRNFDFGSDYMVLLQARDSEGRAQGKAVRFAIRPRHVGPPDPPRNVTVTAAENG